MLIDEEKKNMSCSYGNKLRKSHTYNTSEKLSGHMVKQHSYITVSFSVFRQGDIGTNWYAVLAGSLDVKVSETSSHQVRYLILFFFFNWDVLLFIKDTLYPCLI